MRYSLSETVDAIASGRETPEMITAKEVSNILVCSVREAKRRLWANKILFVRCDDGVRRVPRCDIQLMVDEM